MRAIGHTKIIEKFDRTNYYVAIIFDKLFNYTAKQDLEWYKQYKTIPQPCQDVSIELDQIIQWIADQRKEFPQKTSRWLDGYCFPLINREQSEEKSIREVDKRRAEIGKERLGSGAEGKVQGIGKYAFKFMKAVSQERNLRESIDSLGDNRIFYERYHNFIVEFYGNFNTKDKTFKFMEAFQRIIGKNFYEYECESVVERCRLLAQAAFAIQICHEAGFCALDIKPQNMMITKVYPETDLCDLGIEPQNMMEFPSMLKLIDLGGAVNLIFQKSQMPTITPAFVPYEYIDSKKVVCPAFDVFSLGVTILEQITSASHNMLASALSEKNPDGSSVEVDQKIPEILQGNYEKKYPYGTFVQRVLHGFWVESNPEFLELYPKYQEGWNLTEFYRKKIVSIIDTKCAELDPLDDREASAFLGKLLKDCFLTNPKDRPSAAQVGELLVILESYLECKTKDASVKCPNYEEVKAIAIKDYPKEIPLALSNALFSFDAAIRRNAREEIKCLAKLDPAYSDSPFVLLAYAYKLDPFKLWANEHPKALEELKKRIYPYGWSNQTTFPWEEIQEDLKLAPLSPEKASSTDVLGSPTTQHVPRTNLELFREFCAPKAREDGVKRDIPVLEDVYLQIQLTNVATKPSPAGITTP